jgi:hypothetical protein
MALQSTGSGNSTKADKGRIGKVYSIHSGLCKFFKLDSEFQKAFWGQPQKMAKEFRARLGYQSGRKPKFNISRSRLRLIGKYQEEGDACF